MILRVNYIKLSNLYQARLLCYTRHKMGYQEPQTIHIVVDDKNRPVLQVPENDMQAYLKEKKSRASKAPTKPILPKINS